MFGSALATSLRVAGGLALNPDDATPNGVRRTGIPEPIRAAADIIIHEREEYRVIHLDLTREVHVDIDNIDMGDGGDAESEFDCV